MTRPLLDQSATLWVVLAFTLGFQLAVLRRLRFDRVTVAIALAGTLLYVDYLTYTSVTERNYDGPSHIEYVLSIAEHARLPAVSACGACGHPPLYYAVGAVWAKVLSVFGQLPLELALQWLSLLLFVGFITLALLVLRSSCARSRTLWLAAALIVFWPSSVINSVRVHNDALANVLMLGALYFIAQWDRHGHTRHFYVALGISASAILTKASGYTVAVTLVFIALLRMHAAGWRKQELQRCVTAAVILAAATGLALGFRERPADNTICRTVLGNACYGRYVPAVVDEPKRFLYFDAKDFLERMDTVQEDPTRDYFLNRFAKSSLFGVMPLGDEFGSEHHRGLAVWISALLLGMLVVCLAALPFTSRERLRRYRTYLAASIIMLSFLVAFRLRVPNEFHEDFRHIFPVLVPFCLAYARAVERMEHVSRWLRLSGTALGLLMVSLSLAFFVRAP